VSYLELLPSDHSASANFVRLNFKPAVLYVKKMRLLGKDPGQETDNGPTEETTISCGVASIEEGVLLFRMAMDVTVNPDLTFLNFCKVFEHLLRVINLRLKIFIRVDPLPVKINTNNAITIIAADHSIRIQTRYENKSIELSQKLCFFAFSC
jgi:hypothetical protein